MVSDRRSVIIAALLANFAIALAKLGGYLVTGSPSMLSECYHSFSDTGNQLLLLFGLAFSRRRPTRDHPFGWGKAEFFYGFVVALFLFGIAGWESLREGIDRLSHPGGADAHVELFQQVELFGFGFPSIWVNYLILAFAALFELYAFRKALAGMRDSMRRIRSRNLWHAVRETKEAAILTAFTEDFMALIGLGIATLALLATQLTRDPRFDAIGAVLIGVMLMSFALVLAWEQKRLLLGEAMESWQEDEMRAIFAAHPRVLECRKLRTVHFGPDHILVTANIICPADLEAWEIDETVEQLEAQLIARFPRVKTVYLETDVRPGSGRERP